MSTATDAALATAAAAAGVSNAYVQGTNANAGLLVAVTATVTALSAAVATDVVAVDAAVLTQPADVANAIAAAGALAQDRATLNEMLGVQTMLQAL